MSVEPSISETGTVGASFQSGDETVRILDGGQGFEAIQLSLGRFNVAKHVCWSAVLLHEDQSVVRQVYRRFLEAGAEVITSLSYQADPVTLSANCGVSIERAEQLMRDSVELAKQEIARWSAERAQKGVGDDVAILCAASLGPYGAMLADCSEYSGSYLDSTPIALIRDSYERRVAVLADARPDLLAFETIPSVAELEQVLELLRGRPDLRAWVSMSCPDGTRTARGDSIAAAVDCVNRLATRNIVAFGVNCVVPLFAVKSLVREIRSRLLPWIQVIVYPNNGENLNVSNGIWTFPDGIDDESFYGEIPSWIDEGARWVGGCCRMGSTKMYRVTEIVRGYRERKKSS